MEANWLVLGILVVILTIYIMYTLKSHTDDNENQAASDNKEASSEYQSQQIDSTFDFSEWIIDDYIFGDRISTIKIDGKEQKAPAQIHFADYAEYESGGIPHAPFVEWASLTVLFYPLFVVIENHSGKDNASFLVVRPPNTSKTIIKLAIGIASAKAFEDSESFFSDIMNFIKKYRSEIKQI